MSKCSKEEFAKGSLVSERIFRLIVILVVATAILITVLALSESQTPKIIVGLIYGGLVLVLGGLLVLMLIEKSKCTKWFDTLDADKKENYLAHERGIKSIKRRIKADRQRWNNMFG